MKPANYAPVYAAAMYPELAGIAREHGYALAVHGSLARDFDLIAIPWVEEPQAPQALLDAISGQFAAKLVGGPPSVKAHGRVAYTLSIGFGECFLDLSFMPEAQPSQAQSESPVGPASEGPRPDEKEPACANEQNPIAGSQDQ